MSNFTSQARKDSNNNLTADKSNFLAANSSAYSEIDFCSLISEAKPAAILVNDCGEIEILKKENHSYFYAHELIFHTDSNKDDMDTLLLNENDKDKLCCFAQTKEGSLLLSTEKGVIGFLNLQKSMTSWISVLKTNTDTLNPCDDLYEKNTKKLIDLCVDNANDQIIVLVKFTTKEKAEFKIEIYSFNEKLNEISLTRILNLSQTFAGLSSSSEPAEFGRIYLDDAENAFVIIDYNNHKVYWFNSVNCQAKRCVKSPDGESILRPTGLTLIPELKAIYICSKKGMLICRPDQQSVKHDSIKPIDISYSSEDNCIYFIDEFALYRSKITETMANEQRFKKIFSNKSQNKGFRRVIACRKHIFIMSNDINSLFVIEREHLKF